MRTLAVLLALAASVIVLNCCSGQETFSGGADLDLVISDAIQKDQIPGAVVIAGRPGQVLYEKAYGWRALVPAKEPMTLDTIFDAASLTKVIATTSCIMKLEEQGKVRLTDKVTQYLPEFQAGTSDITLTHLLTHYSGLRPDLDLEPAWNGYETGIRRALAERPASPPGLKFVYSDINFILLGEIVRRVSGKPLPQFAQEQIFAPLGMTETMFQPPNSLMGRIAPTEQYTGMAAPLRGVVHDPTSRSMGGVAGHAGLFSTAADLSKFAEMMLGGGRRNTARIFSPLTVAKFTSPNSPKDQPIRGLGWDIDSPFAGSRGDLYPLTSYGHTGFTGTSLWIDPSTNSYVILLTNSVHPHRRAPITGLRARVANIAAAGLPFDTQSANQQTSVTNAAPGGPKEPRKGQVLTGLDVLVREGFERWKGKRVGLITNQTGLSREGKRNIDLMIAAGVHLTRIFSPEHGAAGNEDKENISNTKDPSTGLPVISLYSGTRRPPAESLRDLDLLAIDIQDVGARFYTYTCTMAYAMQEAARNNVAFVVLDRPNPITGLHVEGPMLDADLRSFVGCFVMPVRHGMTLGELARMFNAAQQPRARLEVVALEAWNRADWFDATGLVWVDPSPNMRSLNAAILYPGVGLLEGGTAYSVGRGTDAPFEQVGADWIRGPELANYLNARDVPGIRVYPTRFQPSSSNFAGKRIEGVRFVITDREAFSSTRFGLELGCALAKLYPNQMMWSANLKLVGDRNALAGISSGQDPAALIERDHAALLRFEQERIHYLLY